MRTAEDRMTTRLDKTIAAGMLVAVALAVLMFGTVEAWSLAVFELIIVALLLLWTAKVVKEKHLKLDVPRAVLPVVVLFAFGLIQSIAFTDSQGRTLSLSYDVEATRAAVIVLFFLLVSFFIAANFFDSRERVRSLSIFLTLFGVALAIFSLIQHFSWEGHLYWFRRTRQLAVFGPFANRNHYAGLMEMLIPVPVAFIVARGVRKDGWLFYGFAATIMGASVFVSLSRGGIISILLGLGFVALTGRRLNRRGKKPVTGVKSHTVEMSQGAKAKVFKLAKRFGAVTAICLAMVIGVIWLGAEGILNRFVETIGQQSNHPSYLYSRDWIWKDTLSMIGANPLTGVGLGAYQTVFPRFSRSDGSLLVEYAHSDYLQILTDAGIIGGLLALWFIVLQFRAVARALNSTDPVLRSFALAGGAGIFSVLVHSLFDFNLQIPSNVLLFLVLTAVVSQISAAVDIGNSQTALQPATRTRVVASSSGVSK